MSTNKNKAFLDTVGLNTLWNKICSVFPNKTGQGASGTWNINVAGSASKITGAKIGIGGAVSSTATTFTGENDITIPITEVKESYLTWGGKALSGAVGPLGASLSSEHSANRIAYLNPNAIAVEYSNDGGANWTNYELSDSTKVNFVTTSGTINIGGPATETVTLNHQTRVTLTAQDGSGTAKVYTRPKKMLMNVCNNNYTINVKIETRTGAKKNDDTAWTNAGSYVVSGWSGWNDIPLVLGNFGGSASQTANIWQIRLTYYITKITSSTDYLTKKPYVLGIRLFGDTAWTPTSNMGNTGHLYSYDWEQNAIFPANVTATKFVGPLEGKASTAAIADLANAVKAPASTSTKLYAALTDGSNNFAHSTKIYANANTGLLTTGSISTGSISASGNITLMASNQHNTDQFINFKYSTTDLDDYSWRIGYIGSGSANENYFAIQNNGVSDKWTNVLHFGLTDQIAYFKNTPKVNVSGTWKNVSIDGHTHNYSLPDHTTPLFIGATSAADGKAGHVPAPLKADRSKFLKGDGTWAAIIAPDVDTSTSGGASQTTDKIFLVGAKTQAEYAQTFSNSEVYSQDGALYSKGTKVSVEGHNHAGVYAPVDHGHNYLPLAGGSMNDGASIKLTQYGNRALTISGNSIVADMSKTTGGWAGAFATLIDPVGDNVAMLGWYGGTEGLTHIYMGGAYDDPFMKMTKSGQFTFKYAPMVGTTKVSLEDHNHDNVYSKLGHTHNVFTTEYDGFVPASGTNTSKYLRGDGTWATPTNSNTIPAAHCATAAATAAKAADFTYYTATANRYFHINFRYANSNAGAITLNINKTGAKPIYINGSASSATNYTLPAGPYIAYYDGTNYYINTDGTIPRVSHAGHTHDDLATKAFVGEQIGSLIGDAPELLDTLGEIADALNDDHNLATNLLTKIDTKLDKITYEYNKELALGSAGKVCIGKFPMYDSNITVDINSTTSTTYHGTLVIATQNINTTGGGSYNATVYGDADNALTDRIRIKYISGSNNFEVYINLPGWSKNSLHIKAVALKAAPTDIATTVDDIPADATIIPVNALYNNFTDKDDYAAHNHDDRYYTETESDERFAAKSHGTHVTGVSFTSGNSSNGEHNCNNIKSNGHWYYTSNGPAKTLGASTDDGALYSQAYSTSWVAQIAQDYRNGNLFTRGLNNGTWTAWKAVSYNGHTHTKSDITDFAHTHDATNITSGTLDLARIPTGTTATTVALGNHVHSASILTSGYLNTHPENNPIVIPFINNDLAFLSKKGGSYEVYKTTSTDFTAATLTKEEITLSSGDNMFDGSPAYATISTTGEYTAVIDMTLHKTFTYSNVFYIDFGAAQWRAKNVSVYVMNSAKESKYVLKQTVSTLATGNWYSGVSHSVTIDGTTTQGFNKLRVVLSGFQSPTSSSGKRIAQIGLLNYGSAGVTETFISRGGCSGIYGSLIPHTTNAVDLGSSSKKWRYVYGALKGTADEAVKLTSSAGSATKPIYFSGGKPVQCNASLDVNISGNAETATTATNLASKPALAASGSNITVTAGGKTSDAFTVPYASTAPWSGITGKPTTFTPSEHNHDSLYIKKNGGGAIINGDLKIATNAGTNGFYVQRGGDTESTKFYQNDAGLNLEVVNDEANADINFYLSATDTERASDKGADAFEKKLIKFAATKANGTSITADKFIGNVTGNVSGSSGSCTGNAATASKLATTRNIKLTGAVTGNADFDGSKAIEIATALNDAVYTESNRFAGWSSHGASDKYYCVAETTLGVSGNATLAYYVTRTHTGSASKGIIQYHVRNDADENGSRKLTLQDWSMPLNIGLPTDAFKLTWKVSGSNVIVKFYVLSTGWNSYELAVLTNSGWGSPLRNTKFYYGAYNETSKPGLSALPSNETVVTTNITVNSVSASDKWSTARTLTIGNTGKTVDGSKNVAWTLAEIGAMAAGDTSHGVHVTTGAQTWSGNKTFNNHIILGGQNSSSSASSTGQILFGASGAKMTSNGSGNIIMNPSSGTSGQIIFSPKSGDSYIKVNGTKVSLEGHTHNDSYYTESEIDTKLGNYVTLSGDQTITGKKTFNANVSVSSGKALTIGDCAITYNATTGCLEITC